MTSKDLIEACDILIKLEQEFATEEAKLSEISNDHAVRIDELDQQITTFRRNEDVDFRVFSPRNISTGNSEKIKAIESEKKQLEREKKEADKQLHYYSGKTEMIGKVLDLLRGDLRSESDEDSITVRKSRDPFAFIDEKNSSDEVIEDKEDEVSALFKTTSKKIKESLFEFSEEEENRETVSEEEDKVVSVEKPVNSVLSEIEKGVPVDEVERICHKVEFCGKIISNDGVRAKLEIKNIAADLHDLIRAYSK